MSFTRVLGQNLAKQIIKSALESSSVAHAYLFYGPESIGKKLTAIEFAKALNCSTPGPDGSCDVCTSCRKIEQRIHPDFYLIEPSKTTPTAKEGAIRIDEIRELQKKLGFQPYEGKTKVAILDCVELMNLQAGNSFLKTLEEPTPTTVLILIASNLHQLLPTVISRCQRIQFTPLPMEAIKQILRTEDVDPDKLDLQASHSRGQVNRALEHDTAQSTQYRQDLVRMIETVSLDNVEVVFEWARAWSKQSDALSAVLDQLMSLLRDLAYLKVSNNHDLYSKDLAKQLKPLAAKKTLPELLNMFDSVQQTKYALSANANTQLSLENMFLRFCDAA